MTRTQLLALVLVLSAVCSATASQAARQRWGGQTASLALSAPPKPLRGVPLAGPTGLRLLVADDPPLLLHVDTGQIARVRGLNVRGNPVLSVLAVGKDAVVSLDHRPPMRVLEAEIYVVRHGATTARRIASAWEVAPAADGEAVWLKEFSDPRHCVLREVGLDGRQRRGPRPIPCATRLIDAGTRPLLGQGSALIDPPTGRTLLRTGGVWAVAGRLALTSGGSYRPLILTDLRSGERRHLPWPSRIGGVDQAAVQANGRLIALAFSDPAYQGGGTQVTDVWLLDPAGGRLQHLPDMPAVVALKFTSMAWTGDGRLVMLAETSGRDVVAVWRPGDRRIAVRRVRLPVRDSGSDAFVVWGRR